MEPVELLRHCRGIGQRNEVTTEANGGIAQIFRGGAVATKDCVDDNEVA
jgi:hypothetical protein